VISSIWLVETYKFLLVCDGKDFFVYGDSLMANSIRGHMERGTGAFASFLKKAKEDQKDDFDPVQYWYISSMNFADEEPPSAFSEKALKNALKRLAELEHQSRTESDG
jgi:hypothetical protein